MTEAVDVRSGGTRRGPKVAWAVAAVIVIAAACGLLIARSRVSTPSTTMAVGHTVPFVLRCSGPGAPCQGGAVDLDANQWVWQTPAYSDIPTNWLSGNVTGRLTISADWGDARFVAADGQELVIGGGRITAEHHFTGQG